MNIKFNLEFGKYYFSFNKRLLESFVFHCFLLLSDLATESIVYGFFYLTSETNFGFVEHFSEMTKV